MIRVCTIKNFNPKILKINKKLNQWFQTGLTRINNRKIRFVGNDYLRHSLISLSYGETWSAGRESAVGNF
ncbi:hypothetical protein ES319_A12G113800v1 [Gossypium barbadense]|uniref:Uncharacterized protein n=2 Tax=Gossypium TaxID=3633 RepID=A0A5J5TCD0_GOSBA|nr:hypothetical protein ES319_A12G113800v1 [Gossypium barbadense]TYG89722.1 hypothetical protein ES288_A12G123200v1 [Gossypium darwinii]